MKYKIGALSIVLSTVLIIGLISFVLDYSSPVSNSNQIGLEKNVPRKIVPKIKNSPKMKPNSRTRKISQEINVQKTLHKDASITNERDKKLILEISQMDQSQLDKELLSLRNQIEKEDPLEKLEQNQTNLEEAERLRASLERYSMLNLEKIRRRYAPVEPELKDPLFAHRNSLREIRDILNDK